MTPADPARHRRLMQLFDEICDLGDDERRGRLAALAGEDAALAGDLARLLAADSGGGAAIEAAAGAPRRIGRYRVRGVLGEGGMGVVYEAEQDLPRRVVAVKVIRGRLASAELRRRFEVESHILGRLNHPGICRIYEAAADEDDCYLAMERVDGRPLGAHAEERRLSVAARLELLARVCDAVHHAHVKGVIHLDLKPANVLVQDDGQPKVLDFGIARIVDPDSALTGMTLSGHIAGTPSYMSPEQTALSRDALDARSDVYTLGAIGYELLSGRLPHDVAGKPLPEIVRRIHDEDARPLGELVPALRGDVETIVGTALARDPQRRYQSAAALADDLRRYLRHEPIAARPPTAAYQLRKLARRHRGVALALGGLAAALVAGAVVSALLARRAERARAALAVRADALAVLEARASLREDPTRAAARLKTLSSAGAWDEARAVAREAEALGVAREVLGGHDSEVQDAAFVGGAATVATVSYDGTLRVWDLAARKTRVVPLGNELHRVACAGQSCVVAGSGGTLVLSDGRRLAGHRGWVRSVAWSPDGTLLASGDDGGELRLWRGDGTPLATVAAAHEGRIQDVTFSGDGARVATGGEDGVVRIFSTDGTPIATLRGHDAEVARVVFAGDGLVSAGRDGKILRWAAGGASRVVADGGDELKRLAAAPDGALAWAGRGGSVWLLPGGASQARVVARHDDVVRALAFSPDGRYLASGGDDRAVRLVDVHSGDAATYLGHQGRVRAVAFSPDGTRLVSASDDGSARVWPVRPPRCQTARRLAVSSRGEVAVAGADRAIRVYGREGAVRVLAGHEDEIYDLEFSPDGGELASASRDRTARVWRDGAQVRVLPCDGRVLRVAWSPSGDRLAAGTHAGVICEGERRFAGHTDQVIGLAFMDDGTLVSASEDGSVRAWPDGRVLARLSERATGLAIAGRRVAVGVADGSVVLVEPDGVSRVIGAHQGELTSLAWSPGGATLATGGLDRVVRLWKDGRAAGVLAATSAVASVAFARDTVLAGGADGTLRAFVAGEGRVVTRGRGPVIDAAVLPDGRVAVVNEQDGLRVIAVGPAAGEADVRAMLDDMTRAAVDDRGVLDGGW